MPVPDHSTVGDLVVRTDALADLLGRRRRCAMRRETLRAATVHQPSQLYTPGLHLAHDHVKLREPVTLGLTAIRHGRESRNRVAAEGLVDRVQSFRVVRRAQRDRDAVAVVVQGAELGAAGRAESAPSLTFGWVGPAKAICRTPAREVFPAPKLPLIHVITARNLPWSPLLPDLLGIPSHTPRPAGADSSREGVTR